MTKSSDSELEKRLRSLTETLIKKQTTIEALSSDKSSLTLELERYKRNQVCICIRTLVPKFNNPRDHRFTLIFRL